MGKMLDGQQKSERAKEEVEQGPYKIHTIPYHIYIEVEDGPYSPKWKWTKKWRRVHTRSIPYHTIPYIEVEAGWHNLWGYR